jgi:hypothetical protein
MIDAKMRAPPRSRLHAAWEVSHASCSVPCFGRRRADRGCGPWEPVSGAGPIVHAGRGRIRGTASTAVLVTATNDPLAVRGSDGMQHLEYDLLVTNTFLAPVRLSAIDVLAPDGARLQRLEGEALLTATQPLLGSQPQQEIPVSGTVAVVMDVTVPPDLAVDRLQHRVAYTIPPDAPDQALLGSYETEGPDLPVAATEPVVIASPLSGVGWLVLNGCCAAASVHRFGRIAAGGTTVAKAEMFSIDWMQLRDRQLNSGDGSRSEDFFGYGAEVRWSRTAR